MVILLVLLAIGVTGGVVWVATGGSIAAQAQQTPAAGSAAEAASLAGTCDEAGSPSILVGVTSANNNTEEFLVATGRVYDISSSDLGKEELFSKNNRGYDSEAILQAVIEDGVFVDTHATVDTGKNSEASVSCGSKYAIVFPRVDGTTVSGVAGWIQDETSSPGFILEIAQNSDVSLSVVDLTQGVSGSAVYESTATSAGSQFNTGATFYNSTGNATDGAAGLVVGSNGEVDVLLRFEDDTSASADEQVRDPFGSMYLLIDLDNEESDAVEFDEATASAVISKGEGSLTFIENAVSEDPSLATLLSKQSYDLAYRIDGQDLADGDDFDVNFKVRTLTDTNADDDIRYAIAVGGLAKSTKGTGLVQGLVDDSSSATPLYAIQSWTQKIS